MHSKYSYIHKLLANSLNVRKKCSIQSLTVKNRNRYSLSRSPRKKVFTDLQPHLGRRVKTNARNCPKLKVKACIRNNASESDHL